MAFSSVMKKMFPFIAAAAQFGGPIAVMAANAAGSAFGINKVEPTPEGIEAAITQAQIKDPDALIKLQAAEQQFQLQMQQLGFEDAEKLEAISAGDRANARARQIAVKDKIPGLLAISVTGGFFGLLWLLCFHRVPVESQTLLNVMIGSLGAAWLGITTYYFGSSAGSARKSELLANTQTKPEDKQ